MKSGLTRERAGDADALALAAGELVRVAVDVALVEPDLAEQLADQRLALRLVGEAVDERALADDLADRHARVEARVRILEDHLQVAADGLHLAFDGSTDFLPALRSSAVGTSKIDLAVERHAPGRRRQEPEDDLAERRLAAAGLPDEAERLAAADVEGHAVDGADRADRRRAEQAALDVEVLDDVLDADQHARRTRRSCDGGGRCAATASTDPSLIRRSGRRPTRRRPQASARRRSRARRPMASASSGRDVASRRRRRAPARRRGAAARRRRSASRAGSAA